MKLKTMLFVVFFSAVCVCQVHPKEIDWKPCQDVQNTLQDRVNKFNAGRKEGLRLEVMCTYSGDPSYKKKPERRIELTPKEKRTLGDLREASTRAWTARDAYENYLFNAHHVRKREPGDPCFNFVGIILDTDFITEDPNPMMAGPDSDCKY